MSPSPATQAAPTPPASPPSHRFHTVLAIGRNYAEHARELGNEVPSHPMVFMKYPGSVVADGVAIEIPPCCRDDRFGGPEQVDYEGELAVVIGTTCRDVEESRALEVVGGYAAANDVSARWWQKHGSGGQFCRGKSFDTFCPIGPVRPARDVPDPQRLRLITRLNGTIVQDARTADMIFPIARLVAELSRGTTLAAGTVILTGTPSGVGSAQTPPRWLRDGDVVEVEVDGVGAVRSPVREAS